VTGRALGYTKPIIEKLGIKSGFAVVNNGGQVVNLSNDELIYDQRIDIETTNKIINIIKSQNIPFYLKDNLLDVSFMKGPYQKNSTDKPAMMFYVSEEFTTEKIDEIFRELSIFSNLALYKAHHNNPGKYGFTVTHIKATKLHGVEAVMKELKLKHEELIGVGDSYNDFPLLMACGLKVAMGNAIEDLKAIADYIAPSVTEDGAAAVIEKFVL
jgi:HAD superfamily hydrolase (TIGR01484 family)